MEFQNLKYPFATKEILLKEKNKIVYADEGESDRVLLFIHDLGGYIPVWKFVIPPLKNYFRCIAIDLPGFGKSGKEVHSGRMTFYSDTIFEFLEQMGLQNVTAVGHGMGGQIAINLSSYYPEVIEKLILAAPSGFEIFDEDEVDWFTKTYSAESFANADDKQIFINFRSNFYTLPAEAEFIFKDKLAIRRDYEYFNYNRIMANSIIGMIRQPVFKKLSHIVVPTLILFGENDAIIPNQFIHRETTSQIAQKGARNIRNSKLVMINECGHYIPLEKPEVIIEEIKKFMGVNSEVNSSDQS